MPHLKIFQRSVTADTHLKFRLLVHEDRGPTVLRNVWTPTRNKCHKEPVYKSEILIQVKIYIVRGPQNFPKI
jgi:hypothetical protein